MGGIYEVHHGDGLRGHDIHTKFDKDWFKHSKVNRGEFTNTKPQRQNGDCISLLSFFSE
jgi:hypothetical protein